MNRLTITAKQFAELLGISLWALYQSVREETCPVEPIRVGRRMVWSSALVADLLGVESLDDPSRPPSTQVDVGPHDSCPRVIEGTGEQFERTIGG